VPLTLIIANKAYSSWSFRPWILMRHFGIAFEEITLPLGQADTTEIFLRYSPTGKCPVLHADDLIIWDSLAIIEYIAEKFPDLAIWPRDEKARATARSLAAEMHSGFLRTRAQLPMNMRRKPAARELTPEVVAEIARLEEAFAAMRRRFGQDGPFLAGTFSAVDAMFAPIVNRFHIYEVPVSAQTRDYMEAMMALPAWRDWEQGAKQESWFIEKYEAL